MHNVSQVGRVPGSTSQSTNYCPLTVSPLFLAFCFICYWQHGLCESTI